MAVANTAHGGAATNTTTSATTLAITVTVAAGEFVFVTVSTLAAAGTTSIADNAAGGSNTYYLLNDQAGASGRISCWFCYSAKACTTITATHVASRASGSVSTYTGVLGVGHCQETTNAANNNTITMSPAIGAGNIMLAGMGDAVGTQTWTAVTGTLRNNIAGGGTTTPGATNIDSLVSGGSTLAASLSSSVSGEAIAIELFGAALPLARDTNEYYSDLKPPVMWSMSTQQFFFEIEHFEWGFQQDVAEYGGHESNIYDFPPTQQVTLPNEVEDEMFSWGYQSAFGGGGKQMMGFRGFWSLKAGMGSSDDWSFNPVAATPAINAFDTVDQAVAKQALGFMSDEVERDNWGWLPPMAQVTLDEAHLDHRFRFDGPAELEAITEDFIVEMVSIDELYTGQINISPIYQEDDQFGFQTAVVTVTQPWDAEYNPGFTKLSAVDDIEQWSYEDAVQDVRDDLVEITMQSWVRAETESEQFGQNAPFLTSNSEPWEQWGQIANPPYPITHQVELDQHGQQTPFLTAQPFDETDQRGDTWWARDVDDNWAFNTPEIEGELLLEEELQLNNQPYPLWQQVEDEQFGKQSPFITSQPFDETIDQIGQTWWTRWQTEDEQFGQNAPFLIPFGFDFILDSYVLSPGALDDVDQFSFQPEISEDLALADEDHFVSMQFLVQEEDVFGMKAPFITSFPSDDSIDQLWNKPYPIVAEDDLVFPASTILANMLYDADFNPTTQQSYYFSSEDLEKYNWGWLPPMTKVAEDDAPYDSRAQIQSFFVPAIEDEQFSWGFDRSRFYALGDEAPYFTPAQQRTYYLPELEDEMFSWGFNQATFPALDQDELPVITAQRMYHEEDFGQQVQFYADSIGDENVTSRYIVSADEDSGMFGLTTTGFTDQLDMSPRNLWSFQEEEPFGFQQQVATAFDDSAEHFSVSARVRDDVEAFGFNPQLPTMDFTLPEERSIEWRMYGEEETWGFAFAYADGIEQAEGVRPQQIIPTEDQPAWGTDGSAAQGLEAYPSAGRLVAIQDDYEQVAISVVQPFSFGDEIDHLPNPPFPITHQLENDQIGQQPPFIISQPFAWEESGVPSNQPWPILDVTDYNDWITNIVFKILRVYDVNIRTVLAVMAILVAQDKVLRQLENGAGYGINVIEATASLAFREVVSVPRFTAQAILGSSLSIT